MGTLNERIAALRKERGLTQEQLGQRVGVSSQAVSKWEKGGAPDVELLPILAAQLNVTIDALFGLEGGGRLDIKREVGHWIQGFPQEERMDQFCRLLWSCVGYLMPDGLSMPVGDYLETCRYGADGGGLITSQCEGGGGTLLDVHGEDLSFVTLWPKPAGGWGRWLSPKSEYRRLFGLLAQPGCLELLGYLHSRTMNYHAPAAVAAKLELPRERVEELLEALEERQILRSIRLEVEEGEIRAYTVAEPQKLIPFLLLARCLMQEGMNYLKIHDGVPPLGKEELWRDGEGDDRV